MDTPSLGRLLLAIGLLIAAIGLFLIFKERLPWLSRIGRLPGDFSYESDNVKIFIPLTTSILVSLAVSLLVWLFRSRS